MSKTITISSIRKVIQNELKPLYPNTEVEGLERIILEETLENSWFTIISQGNITVNETQVARIHQLIAELKTYRPIQHILGYSWFYDLKFQVSPNVLVPRQETEELVHLIIQENNTQAKHILDIGTGSGCIAVSLAQNLPKSTVAAYDISAEALQIAKTNTLQNNAQVNYHKFDILNETQNPTQKNFDIIVSNPPYVRNSEKKHMHDNVLKHDPHLALFVDDSDPLIFYRKIGEYALKHVNQNGLLYVEINEALGRETAQLFNQQGFTNTKIIKDLQGKDRFVKAVKEF